MTLTRLQSTLIDYSNFLSHTHLSLRLFVFAFFFDSQLTFRVKGSPVPSYYYSTETEILKMSAYTWACETVEATLCLEKTGKQGMKIRREKHAILTALNLRHVLNLRKILC